MRCLDGQEWWCQVGLGDTAMLVDEQCLVERLVYLSPGDVTRARVQLIRLTAQVQGGADELDTGLDLLLGFVGTLANTGLAQLQGGNALTQFGAGYGAFSKCVDQAVFLLGELAQFFLQVGVQLTAGRLVINQGLVERVEECLAVAVRDPERSVVIGDAVFDDCGWQQW